jgi:hypothetical protein
MLNKGSGCSIILSTLQHNTVQQYLYCFTCAKYYCSSTRYIILLHSTTVPGTVCTYSTTHQSPSFEVGPWCTQDLRRRTEIISVKGYPLQNKTVGFGQRPRPLHNRYTRTNTCVRWGMAIAYSRYKFVTISLPKRFRNGRFTSETATWIQKWFKKSVGTSRKSYL